MAKVGKWRNPPASSIKGNPLEDRLAEEIRKETEEESRRGDIISDEQRRREEAAKDLERIVITKVDRERGPKA